MLETRDHSSLMQAGGSWRALFLQFIQIFNIFLNMHFVITFEDVKYLKGDINIKYTISSS